MFKSLHTKNKLDYIKLATFFQSIMSRDNNYFRTVLTTGKNLQQVDPGNRTPLRFDGSKYNVLFPSDMWGPFQGNEFSDMSLFFAVHLINYVYGLPFESFITDSEEPL